MAPLFTIPARYRQRYLLSFTPTGVKTGDGWHRIEVKLRKRPGTVVAREGYMARPQVPVSAAPLPFAVCRLPVPVPD